MKGIYAIKVNECLVYIGQAIDINTRIGAHISSMLHSKENKYELLKDARSRNQKITFWLLEEVEDPDKRSEAEMKWIKALRPCLNSKGTHNIGYNLTAQEFYEYILNNKHEFKATQIFYESWRKK